MKWNVENTFDKHANHVCIGIQIDSVIKLQVNDNCKEYRLTNSNKYPIQTTTKRINDNPDKSHHDCVNSVEVILKDWCLGVDIGDGVLEEVCLYQGVCMGRLFGICVGTFIKTS